MANCFLHWAAFRFTQFKQRGIWENILDSVISNERKRQGRNDTPSLLAIDRQSGRRWGVKKVQFTNEKTGIDGRKNVNGRKRTILVDTLGLPWSIKVTVANISDNQAGIMAIDCLAGKSPEVEKNNR